AGGFGAHEVVDVEPVLAGSRVEAAFPEAGLDALLGAGGVLALEQQFQLQAGVGQRFDHIDRSGLVVDRHAVGRPFRGGKDGSLQRAAGDDLDARAGHDPVVELIEDFRARGAIDHVGHAIDLQRHVVEGNGAVDSGDVLFVGVRGGRYGGDITPENASQDRREELAEVDRQTDRGDAVHRVVLATLRSGGVAQGQVVGFDGGLDAGDQATLLEGQAAAGDAHLQVAADYECFFQDCHGSDLLGAGDDAAGDEGFALCWGDLDL